MLFTINKLRTYVLRDWTILTLSVCLLAAPLVGAPMTKEDREHLVVHFEMTTQMVAEQVRGLSPAQLEYKASPDRWSIREVVSHLAVAEPDYWRDIQKALRAAPDMNSKKSVATDADILWYGIDRVVHTKTGGGHEKVDTYKDLGQALGKFQVLLRHHDRLHQDHPRRHAGAQLRRSRGDRLLAVDARDFYARRTTHPADSRDQKRPELSDEVNRNIPCPQKRRMKSTKLRNRLVAPVIFPPP